MTSSKMHLLAAPSARQSLFPAVEAIFREPDASAGFEPTNQDKRVIFHSGMSILAATKLRLIEICLWQ